MKSESLDLSDFYRAYGFSLPYQKIGKVRKSQGILYRAILPRAIVGCSVEFITERGDSCFGEVVAIDKNECLVMPYEDLQGINSETRVVLRTLSTDIRLTQQMLGRVLDFEGNPLDNLGPIDYSDTRKRSLFGEHVNPLDRPPITSSLDTGIHAINCFATLGKGQRLAILAGSGVGKSVTLGMMAQNTAADVNVVALIGERGREVLEFIENDLGPEGLKKSIIIAATSDQSPLVRIKAAYFAMTIAEYFRDLNKDVLFMMDSITRFAQSIKEITLSAGEPPGVQGNTPSVFSRLPKLMERVGTKRDSGSITGIFTVLVEGDDMDGPIADAVRSISDGHIVLSRDLAAKNHYPPIDILSSVSRVMNRVVTPEFRVVSSHLRNLLAAYVENEDLINVGAYVKGSNAKVDKALVIYDDLMNLMRQELGMSEFYQLDQLFDYMVEIARKAENIDVNNSDEKE